MNTPAQKPGRCLLLAFLLSVLSLSAQPRESFFDKDADGKFACLKEGYFRAYLEPRTAPLPSPIRVRGVMFRVGPAKKPGVVAWHQGLTIMEAVLQLGPVAMFGMHKRMGIWKCRAGRFVKLDLQRLSSGREEDLVLEPGDLVVFLQMPDF